MIEVLLLLQLPPLLLRHMKRKRERGGRGRISGCFVCCAHRDPWWREEELKMMHGVDKGEGRRRMVDPRAER